MQFCKFRTWEENRARQQGPWLGRTLCRGLEIGSYAMAKGRRWNVETGKLLDTPCFEWLDAFETKTTSYYISLKAGPAKISPLDTVF